MKLKNLKTESNGFVHENIQQFLEETADKLATIRDIPATIEIFKGRDAIRYDTIMAKRFRWLGKEEVPRHIKVSLQTLGACLDYRHPSTIEAVFNDLEKIKKVSGLNFSECTFMEADLYLKVFKKTWGILINCGHSDELMEQNPGEETTAIIDLSAPISSEDERKALRDISDNLYETKEIKKGRYETKNSESSRQITNWPHTKIVKNWKGAFSEEEVLKFFKRITEIDRHFGITANFLKKKGIVEKEVRQNSPKYTIDLLTGDMTQPELISTRRKDYDPYLGIEVAIYQDQLTDNGARPFYQFRYSHWGI